MRYLDAVALAKLKSLSLKLGRLSSESQVQGGHKSVLRGFSRDFAQHRAYAPGDELKNLDWKVYARTDRFYVKEFISESIFSGYILVDGSGSMAYGAQGRAAKWDYACRLSMAFSYLILSRGDAAGLQILGAEAAGTPKIVDAQKSLGRLGLLDDVLAAAAPAGKSALARGLDHAALRLRRRSFVVVISDLLDQPERVVAALKALKARKHELAVCQVLDPVERDFPFDGPTEFECLENGERFFCEASVLRQSYRQEFSRALVLYEASLSRLGAAYVQCPTDIPWDQTLKRLLTSVR